MHPGGGGSLLPSAALTPIVCTRVLPHGFLCVRPVLWWTELQAGDCSAYQAPGTGPDLWGVLCYHMLRFRLLQKFALPLWRALGYLPNLHFLLLPWSQNPVLLRSPYAQLKGSLSQATTQLRVKTKGKQTFWGRTSRQVS